VANAPNINRSQLYLWQQRTLFIGRFEEALELAQGAATLTVSLDQPITFKTKEMSTPINCHSLILPPGFSVTIDTQHARVANCHLDVLGHDYYRLFSCAQNSLGVLGYALNTEVELAHCFTHMLNSKMNSKEAFTYLEIQLKESGDASLVSPSTDKRILHVIELVQNAATENVSGEALARSVNLSIPRLAQLFKQQTGIPIRKYRLWHRLYLTAQNVGKGQNLTDAAIAAGFTDSSHFAHTFRAMLGMTPSHILSQVKNTRIII